MSAMKLLGQLLGGSGGGMGAKPGREADLMRLVERQLGSGGLQALMGGRPGGYGSGGHGSPGHGSGAPGLGALGGGVLGLLMKGGKKRKGMHGGMMGGGMGGGMGTAAKLGGLGLVAGLAYKAWQEHQAQQAAAARPATSGTAPAAQPAPAYAAPEGGAFLPAQDAEQQRHARAILRAMIAAAKADGHVDDAERQRLHEAVDTLDLDADDKAFLFDELRAPLDVGAVAREATTPELAAEIYAASLIMADETDARERAYLDQLAVALRLEPGLARRLEAEVAAAG